MHFDYMFTIIIVGNSDAGKSSLMRRYCKNTFDSELEKTVGIDLSLKTVKYKEKIVKLRIWDTSGQERFGFLTNSYYNDAQGVIVGFDSSSPHNRVEDWVSRAEKRCHNVPIVIAANKTDKTPCNPVEIYSFRYQCVMTSAKTGESVDTVFKTLIKKCIDANKPQRRPSRITLGIEDENKKCSPCF